MIGMAAKHRIEGDNEHTKNGVGTGKVETDDSVF